MKNIGFVDYYIGEWHANNYPAWIDAAAKKLGAEYKVAYVWAEEHVSPKYGTTTDEWCNTYGVQKCETISELCEKSDVIVILAPSDPDKHLGYAEEVLKYGKRTYIDKTFSPDLATAKKIFELGEKYGTPFFSTSALRYADELDAYESCKQMIVTGGGSNFPEYSVHLFEMIVKKLGIGATRVRAEKNGLQTYIYVGYADERAATAVYSPALPYTVYMSDGIEEKGVSEKPVYKQVISSFFDGLIADMVNFFESGDISFDVTQTLEVMKIREGAIIATENLGKAVDLSALG